MTTVLPDTFSFNRDTQLFVKKQVDLTTEAKPAAADLVLASGDGSVRQDRAYEDDPQRRNTYSKVGRLQGGFNPGDMSFPSLVKPSGSAGTKPEGAALWESAYGRETVNAGVSVVYELLRIDDTRPALTCWLKKGHIVYRAIGALVNQLQHNIRGGDGQDSYANLNWTLIFSELRWTGTDELDTAAAASATTLSVKDASKFTVGSYIKVAADDNGGAGYEVTAVDLGANDLTINPGLTGAAVVDALVAPWLPTGTELGEPVHGRLGLAQHGSDDLPLMTSQVTLNNNLDPFSGEKNNKDYFDRFGHDERDVQVTCDIRMDANATRFIDKHNRDSKDDVTIPAGNVAGKILTLVCKNVGLNFPTDNDNPTRDVNISGTAYASATFDDELKATFT